jgi:RES domain-containing protein
MARLPLPPDPAVLRALLRPDQDVRTVPAGTRLVRIFTAGSRHPQRWNGFRRAGPLPHGRFDPQRPGEPNRPDPAEPGVLYFSLSARTSIAEVFQLTSVVDQRTGEPHLVVVRPERDLRLLDLVGLWPTRAGASQEISSGAKDRTQAWARAIRQAHPDLDGVWYRSSMDSGHPALCLWDPPAGDAMPAQPHLLVPLSHPGLALPLGRLCEQLNYTLLD